MISIGKRLAVGIGNRGNRSWTPQNLGAKILFWGAVSEISGGEMPNKVTGLSDFITVAGSPSTFQVPNTAAYIAADTDYLWIDTSEDLIDRTTAVLISKDFSRTFVKYGNVTPNAIEEIMIIKEDCVIDQSFKDNVTKYFQLHPFYFNEYNANGFFKDNRTNYDPYIYILPALSDGDTIGFGDYLTNVTLVGTKVSSWADALGSGFAVVQSSDGARPLIDLDGGVDADGINDDAIYSDGATSIRLKSANIVWNQPEMIFLVCKVKTWIVNSCLFDGSASHSGKLYQYSATPNHSIGAGTLNVGNIDYTLDKWCIVRVLLNGDNSKHILNNGAAVTGNPGAANMSAFTLFSRGGAAIANPSNIKVKAWVCRKSATSEVAIANYLRKKYRLTGIIPTITTT